MYVQIEPLAIGKITIVTVGTTAADVVIAGKSVLLQNQHETNIVYVKDKKYGAVTTSTGLAIFPKESITITAETLSVIASGATTSLAVVELN
jgi:hypothetical protein